MCCNPILEQLYLLLPTSEGWGKVLFSVCLSVHTLMGGTPSDWLGIPPSFPMRVRRRYPILLNGRGGTPSFLIAASSWWGITPYHWWGDPHLANGGVTPSEPGVPPVRIRWGTPHWDWMGMLPHQDWMGVHPPSGLDGGSHPPVERFGDWAATRWAVCLLHSHRTFLFPLI